MVVLTTSANALFLRNRQQQQQQQRNLNLNNGLDTLSTFGLDPSAYNNNSPCPSKQCRPLSFFKSINSGILETETQCTSTDNCEFACLYDSTAMTFVCEENVVLDVEEKCNLLCVQEDDDDDDDESRQYRDSHQPICQDYKMCLPLSSLKVVSGGCKGPQDCTGLGECRYNTNTQTTLCDITDGSLCAYDCVEDDSYQVIPTFRDSNHRPIVVCEDYKMCLPFSTLDVVQVGCTRTEDCELGECRYISNTKTTLCDTADGSLCGYNCVDP